MYDYNVNKNVHRSELLRLMPGWIGDSQSQSLTKAWCNGMASDTSWGQRLGEQRQNKIQVGFLFSLVCIVWLCSLKAPEGSSKLRFKMSVPSLGFVLQFNGLRKHWRDIEREREREHNGGVWMVVRSMAVWNAHGHSMLNLKKGNRWSSMSAGSLKSRLEDYDRCRWIIWRSLVIGCWLIWMNIGFCNHWPSFVIFASITFHKLTN